MSHGIGVVSPSFEGNFVSTALLCADNNFSSMYLAPFKVMYIIYQSQKYRNCVKQF